MARQLGLASNIQATPAVALGAYEMTPVEVAAGYTAFASQGVRAEPLFIRSVVDTGGNVEESSAPQNRPVLDPRVAFLSTSLMEDVIDHGTGYPVRALGFNAPAAGKTGTSRDGWFAGYTSNLLCIVWVGFDDNRDLGLTGGVTAAPIWGEFMKRAVAQPLYRKTQPFAPPDGLVEELVDAQTGELATPSCPQKVEEYFVAGSEPTQYCQVHGGGQVAQSPGGSWLSRLFEKDPGTPPAPPTNNTSNGPGSEARSKSSPPASSEERPVTQPNGEPQKKGVLGRIFGIFGGSKKSADDPNK
jgi:penicillin-binding protein 1B